MLFSLAWTGEPHWSDGDIKAALREEALTVSLSDHVDAYKAVKRRLQPQNGVRS